MIGYGWSGALAQCDLASAWARTWAFLARVLRAMRLLLGDATLPRWLRIGLAACLLPILGPFDEIALVILASIVWVFYRSAIKTAWSESGVSA